MRQVRENLYVFSICNTKGHESSSDLISDSNNSLELEPKVFRSVGFVNMEPQAAFNGQQDKEHENER